MKDLVTWLKNHLLDIYDRNPFVKLLQMEILELREGETRLAMPVEHQLTNLYQMAHGGALTALADTSMGLSCASLGKRVVTLDLSINFIRGAEVGQTVAATAKVIHNGKNTLVTESELVNTAGDLIAKARGTFFVIGQFEPDSN
ncbi:MAG: PaaI family thioesterase [Negativicutes bacterium]|nr:PaaI family thioesterase [Negativicutes bacterium]